MTRMRPEIPRVHSGPAGVASENSILPLDKGLRVMVPYEGLNFRVEHTDLVSEACDPAVVVSFRKILKIRRKVSVC
jgi:hypothetical protein